MTLPVGCTKEDMQALELYAEQVGGSLKTERNFSEESEHEYLSSYFDCTNLRCPNCIFDNGIAYDHQDPLCWRRLSPETANELVVKKLKEYFNALPSQETKAEQKDQWHLPLGATVHHMEWLSRYAREIGAQLYTPATVEPNKKDYIMGWFDCEGIDCEKDGCIFDEKESLCLCSGNVMETNTATIAKLEKHYSDRVETPKNFAKDLRNIAQEYNEKNTEAALYEKFLQSKYLADLEDLLIKAAEQGRYSFSCPVLWAEDKCLQRWTKEMGLTYEQICTSKFTWNGATKRVKISWEEDNA